MDIKIPDNLIFPDSRLCLYYEDEVKVNETKSAIIFEGTRNGFLSLANVLLHQTNELHESIEIHNFPFVKANIELTIKEMYEEDKKIKRVVKPVPERAEKVPDRVEPIPQTNPPQLVGSVV